MIFPLFPLLSPCFTLICRHLEARELLKQVPRLSPDMSVTFSLVPEIEPDPDEAPFAITNSYTHRTDMQYIANTL